MVIHCANADIGRGEGLLQREICVGLPHLRFGAAQVGAVIEGQANGFIGCGQGGSVAGKVGGQHEGLDSRRCLEQRSEVALLTRELVSEGQLIVGEFQK